MGHYFKHRKLPYFFYEGITVVKEEASADNTFGSQTVKDARAYLTEWVTLEEAKDPLPSPAAELRPPPIKFLPRLSKEDEKKGKIPKVEQTLARFIVDYVLPNAMEPTQSKARDAATKNTAMCQAVEQTICKAMDVGNIYDAGADNALDKIFKFNGARPQRVVRVDKP